MRKETVPICFRVPASKLEWLKSLARQRAVEQSRDVSYTDLCRDALDIAFPEPPSSEAPEPVGPEIVPNAPENADGRSA